MIIESSQQENHHFNQIKNTQLTRSSSSPAME